MPRRALIAVDVQNDFCPGGALAVPDGDAVVAPLNALMDEVDLVVATRDWHPEDHGSFRERGGTWPVHCIAGTPGAELHEGLDRSRIDVVVDKGQDPVTEGYSGFDGTRLAELLREQEVEEVVVGGLATDYCVRATALEALEAGFAVVLDSRASRGIDVQDGDVARTLDEVRAAGGTVV